MGLAEFKFNDNDFAGKNVKALPDVVVNQAQWLKARFDNVGENVLAKRVNQILDRLASSAGAADLGAAAQGLAGTNVQAILTELKQLLDSHKSILAQAVQTANNSQAIARAAKDYAESVYGVAMDAKQEALAANTTAQQALNVASGVAATAQRAEKLAAEAKKLAEGVYYMHDPSTGQYLPLQEVFNNIYNAGRMAPITAAEYAALALTADSYAAKRISAADYSTRAKQLLGA